MPVKTNLNSMQNVTKKETYPILLKHLALEMKHTRYPTNKYMHIFTDGSKLDDHTHAGAGTHSELFSCYKPLGQPSTAYDGETEVIPTASRYSNNSKRKKIKK